MTAARMNIFQRLARQWDSLHPYNAAQILHIEGHADPEALGKCWRKTLGDMGLGRVRVQGSRFWHEPFGEREAQPSLQQVPRAVALERHINEELNRPFDQGESSPLRPFVLQVEDSYYAGVVYHHWVADSVSIRLLLREWFLRLHDLAQASVQPFEIPRRGYWRLFGPGAVDWNPTKALLDLARWSARIKRIRRIEADAYSDLHVRFTLHTAPPGWIHRLHVWAKERQVALNDVFLAAMAEACDQHVPAHHLAKRPDLALGTIVDLRPQAREDLSRTFGLFLGFTNVTCRRDELHDFPRLVRTISTQNQFHKTEHAAHASAVRMLTALTAGHLLSRRRLLNFYRKRVPLVGGISNINLTNSWAARYHPSPLLDYIRVSPDRTDVAAGLHAHDAGRPVPFRADLSPLHR